MKEKEKKNPELKTEPMKKKKEPNNQPRRRKKEKKVKSGQKVWLVLFVGLSYVFNYKNVIEL